MVFEKTLFLLYSINWPEFIFWLSLICIVLDNIGIVIVFNQVVKICKLTFLIKQFFLHDQKIKTEI